jgi:hypothetical protein
LFTSLLGPHLLFQLLGRVLGERINKKHVGPFGTSFIISFVGPYPHKDKDNHIGSNFWKFYLIKINFRVHKLVSLVKVFILFSLE